MGHDPALILGTDRSRDISAYYAAPGAVPSAPARQETLAPILVAFAGPSPQSRLTVLVRILMVIPQLIVLGLLGIAVYVIAIIGWFRCSVHRTAARLRGRFPHRIPALDGAGVRVHVPAHRRVSAILPGGCRLSGPGRGDARRLNRLAVLFRFFLLIPCWIVVMVVGYGAFTIVGFVTWLIVLISGRMPDALRDPARIRRRPEVRGSAWVWLRAGVRGAAGRWGGRKAVLAAHPVWWGEEADGRLYRDRRPARGRRR